MSQSYLVFYYLAMTISLLTCLTVVVLSWKNREAPGARAMLGLAVATFIWGFGFTFEAASSSLSQQILFNNIGYIGSMSVPVTWLLFAILYTNAGKPFANWKKVLLSVFPFFIIIMVWSNDAHQLMWSNEHQVASGPFLVVAKTYGPLFWIAVVHNYTLVISGAIILIRQLFIGVPLYRKQAFILLFAACLPLVWNAIYVFDLLSLPRKDLTPVMFAISGIAITLGLMRFKLFKTIPFAYPIIVQQMNDGVLVFDNSDHLLETNPAACRMTGLDNSMVGHELKDICHLSPLLECLAIADFGHLDLESTSKTKGQFFDLDKQPLFDKRHQQVGWLATIRDISQRKQTAQELKERKEQYFTLVEHGNDGIAIVQNGLIIYANSKIKEMSGYQLEEILEKPFTQFVSPEQRKTVEKYYQKRIGGQESAGRYEARLINKQGQEVYVEISASIIEYEGQIADIAIAALLTILILPALLFSSCAAIAEMTSDQTDNPDAVDNNQISDPDSLVEWQADGVITTNEYSNSANISANFTLFSRTDDQYVYIGIKAKASGWISIGFQPVSAKGHTGADFALGGVSSGQAYIYDLWGISKDEHSLDTKLGGTNSILAYGATESGGYTILEFKRLLSTGDSYDQNIVHGSNNVLWAYSDEDGFAAMHIAEGTAKINIP